MGVLEEENSKQREQQAKDPKGKNLEGLEKKKKNYEECPEGAWSELWDQEQRNNGLGML